MRPTLQEIASMPYPASLKAMREHYNPAWGKDIGDGEKEFTIEVTYEVRNSETVTVEAFTADEAEELAANKVCKQAADSLCVSEYKVACASTRVIERKN